MRRREAPLKRRNPSGKTRWVARWTDKTGRKRYGFPPDIAGTHATRREAQDAIEACYERDAAGPACPRTLGDYFATWTANHPRAKVTNKTNETRIRAVLDVKVDGAPLRDWPFDKLRRRHASALVTHMLAEQGRAYTGAQGILRALSAMTEDAIEDEVAIANPFRGVKIRANDPRIQKQIRKPRVWSWPELHAFAAECAVSPATEFESIDPRVRALAVWRSTHAEPMVRSLSDLGLRIGEAFGARVSDFDPVRGLLEIRQTVSLGEIVAGTKTDHSRPNAGRVVPVSPVLCGMLKAMLATRPTPLRPEEALLFPTPQGAAWWYTNFSRGVWKPACKRLGVYPNPHESRHSFVTHMRAAGVPDADLAAITGHSVLTMVGRYAHSLGLSFDDVRRAVGE